MHFLKRYLPIAMLCVTAIAKAQQTPPPVTLKQLLSSVDQKAPQLITDSAAINIREAQAAETRNNWLPNLTLNYQADIGTSNNVTGPYFGFGDQCPSSSGGVHGHQCYYSTATGDNLGIAELNWEVYNFGKYGAQNKVANSDITVQQNQFAESKYDLQCLYHQ